MLDIAAAQHDIVGLESRRQAFHRIGDVGTPFFQAGALLCFFAQILLEGPALLNKADA